MRAFQIIFFIITLLIFSAFGINYYLWDKQTKEFDAIIHGIETSLDQKGISMSYDNIHYIGHKSWKVHGEIGNLKFSSKEHPEDYYSMKSVSFINDAENHKIVLIGNDASYSMKAFKNEFTQEEIYPAFNMKITYSGALPTLSFYFDQNIKIDQNSNPAAIAKSINKIEFTEGPSKAIDLDTNQEMYSSDSSKIVYTTDLKSEIKKVGFLMDFKNLRMKLSKDSEMTSPQNYSLDSVLEFKMNKTIENLQTINFEDIEYIKLKINDLSFSNELTNWKLNGDLDYDKTSFLPSVTASLIIGNYEKLIDYAEQKLSDISKDIKAIPAPSMVPMIVPSHADKKDIENLKKFLSQFKINDTDLKFDLIFDKSGNTTVSGKSLDALNKEFIDLMTPPPPAADLIPAPTMPIVPVDPNAPTTPSDQVAPSSISPTPEANIQPTGPTSNPLVDGIKLSPEAQVMPQDTPMPPKPDLQEIKPADIEPAPSAGK